MNPIRFIWRGTALSVAFLRDLTMSSVGVARAVISPNLVAPRFVTVPLTTAETDIEITLVANYITLTPGTLTVDVSPDRKTLLLHALLAGDDSQATRADVAGIEARVTGVTRA